jgi:predicted acetyltransferase
MTRPTLPTDWTLSDVKKDERPLLDRLLQFYLYDFSEIDPDDVGEDGRFSYDVLDRYGRDSGHDALLLRVGGKPAGFALVDERSTLPGSSHRHYVHEFHVLRAYRRKGYGLAMAWAVFDRYPGLWQIEEIGPNLDAQAFWRRAVDLYTGGRYDERTTQAKRFHLVIQEFDTRDKAVT